MAVDAWIEEQAPLAQHGLEMKERTDDAGGGEIVPIKSCKIEGALQLQVYIERPPI